MKNESDELNKAIIALQEKRINELESFQEHLLVSQDGVDPNHISKITTIKEVNPSSGIKNDVLGFVIGVGSGFVFKKLFVGKSKHPIKRMLGTAIHFAMANVVSRHSDGIITAGENLLNRIFKRRKE